MFSSSIPHYIIWSDKCYLVVHISVEIHLLKISMNCRLSQSATSSPLLDLMMNSCVGTRSIVHFPRILHCHLVNYVAPFLPRYPATNQNWISVWYDGWNIFPRDITLVFMWPGKVMSCLAHLAGGPIVIDSFSARLSILPWGNCKSYYISCFWWILCIQSLTFAWRPCQCYLEACLWYSDFQ